MAISGLSAAVNQEVDKYAQKNLLADLPTHSKKLVTNFLTGTATQLVRVAVYGKGKLDFASLAADAFGNAIGEAVVDHAQRQAAISAAADKWGINPKDPLLGKIVSHDRGFSDNAPTALERRELWTRMMQGQGASQELIDQAQREWGNTGVWAGPLKFLEGNGSPVEGSNDWGPDAFLGNQTLDRLVIRGGRVVEKFEAFVNENPLAQYMMSGLEVLLGGVPRALASWAASQTEAAQRLGEFVAGKKQQLQDWLFEGFSDANHGQVNSRSGAQGVVTSLSMASSFVFGKMLGKSTDAVGVGAPGRGSGGANSASPGTKLTFDSTARTWTTPKGVVYGEGSAHGNRIKHVLDHTVPNPTKTTHTLFNVDRKEVLGLIDEAWAIKGAPLPKDPGAYVVPMGRSIGVGGETSLKIIVRPGTNKILTAYPVK